MTPCSRCLLEGRLGWDQISYIALMSWSIPWLMARPINVGKLMTERTHHEGWANLLPKEVIKSFFLRFIQSIT